jgi:hypothetical protein
MQRCSETGPVGWVAGWILVALLIGVAIFNIARGEARHPWAFAIVLLGFVLFVVSKLSVILHRQRISFGTRLMSTRVANSYRLGYWLMAGGLLVTFA